MKYVALLDLEKAFDRIQINKLWTVMEHRDNEINAKVLRAINSLFKDNKSKERTKIDESNWKADVFYRYYSSYIWIIV